MNFSFNFVGIPSSFILSVKNRGGGEIILSTDRSEPRLESHTGGKMRKTLKNDKNFVVFCYFFGKSDSKLFRPDQENERRDI